MMNRREWVTVATAGAATMAAGGVALAAAPKGGGGGGKQGASVTPLVAGKHEPMAKLPFDTAKLTGISQKMIESHYENNYKSAVKNLNKVEADLESVNKDTPGYTVFGLKERELTYTNSMILHEHYFGNLGGNGKIGGGVEKALATAYGSTARWEELIRATAMSEGGGSGWTVLDWNFHTGELRSYWSGGHTAASAFAAPLLVLDMYEHAYQMDYGAAHAKYIDAFFANINWDTVNARFERAAKAAAILKA